MTLSCAEEAQAGIYAGALPAEWQSASGAADSGSCADCAGLSWRGYSLSAPADAASLGAQAPGLGGGAASLVQGPPDEAADTPPAPAHGRLAADDARIVRQVRNMQIAFHVLNAIDGAQIIALTSKGKHKEVNPIYGKHPSAGKVIGIKLASSLVHQLISDAVLRRSPKAARTFEIVSISIQGGAVLWNLTKSF